MKTELPTTSTGINVFNLASAVIRLYSPMLSSNTSFTKLLASKVSWASVIQLTWYGSTKLLILFGRLPTFTQALKRNSAKCMKIALAEQAVPPLSIAAFEHRNRLTDTDRHASNNAAEVLLSQSRCHDHLREDHKCKAHIIVQIHNEASRQLNGLIRAVLHLALTTDSTGASTSKALLRVVQN